MFATQWKPMLALTVAVLFLGPDAGLFAAKQTPPDDAAAGPGWTVSEAKAFVGKPLGVVVMEIQRQKPISVYNDLQNFFIVGEDSNRVFYPVYVSNSQKDSGRFGRKTDSIKAQFLFQGETPLKLEFVSRDGEKVSHTLQPEKIHNQYKDELFSWWRNYYQEAQRKARLGDYPPQLETYLVTMLARRFNFQQPTLNHRWSGRQDLDQILGILMGAESIRVAMQRDTLLGETDRLESADQPLPKPTNLPPVDLPEFDKDAAVEPIALHVPAECFYARCGSFSNFRWLRSKVDIWGTLARDLTSVRGLDYGIQTTIEQQLALKETLLSKMLGDAVISDVAIIGMDPFFKAGSASGILFEARSSTILKLQLDKIRTEAIAGVDGATLQDISINGKEVSLASTPDHRVRSYYAVHGKYHLVTTSRTLAKRFLEASAGDDSLGRLDEFRYARSKMPLADGHDAFLYLSDPFFRNLVGPHYRVEMTRRMQALAELELTQLARITAEAEGQPAESILDLIAGEYLPDDFENRPDGSQAVLVDDVASDSLRGVRGTFLPVPDIEIEQITESETEAYREFDNYYRNQWRRMDPVIIGIHRKQLDDASTERIVLDIHITPYARQHYETLAQFLTRPDKKSLANIKGDLLSVQARIDWGGLLGGGGFPFHLFAGYQDFDPKFEIKDGYVSIPKNQDDMFVYYGARPGFWLFGHDPTKKPDEDGYIESTEHWTRHARLTGDIHTASHRRDVLEKVTPQLKFIEAERDAQIRLKINDISSAKSVKLLHAQGYMRARETSAGNVQFMNTLMEQMKVEPEQAKEISEFLLGATMICPLGGEYMLRQANGLPQWHSTAWKDSSFYEVTEIPENYKFPFLQVFRGLNLEFSIDRTTLTTYLEVDLKKTP